MPEPDPLLELQRIDLAKAALQAERAALPERAQLEEHRAMLERLAAEAEAAQRSLEPLTESERQLEDEVSALRDQAREAETTLYSGSVRIASELADLQAKLSSLQRQRAAREDAHLEVLEQQEALEDALRRLAGQVAEIERRDRQLTETLAAREARIDARLDDLRRQREHHLLTVPQARLAAYERLRASGRREGVAAAALEGDACGACHTTLPVTHVSRIRAAGPDEVVTCQSCQRLLVAAQPA